MSFNQRPGKYHIVKLLRVHGLYGCREVDPSTVVRVRPGEYQDLGVRVLGVLEEPVTQGEHHGTGPAVQFLGVVHGEGGHVVLGAAQH